MLFIFHMVVLCSSLFLYQKQTNKTQKAFNTIWKGGVKYKQPTYLQTEIQSVVFGIIILLSYCFHNNSIIPPPINWIIVSNYVCYIYQTPSASATVHQRITFAHLCSSAVNFHSMILNQLFFFLIATCQCSHEDISALHLSSLIYCTKGHWGNHVVGHSHPREKGHCPYRTCSWSLKRAGDWHFQWTPGALILY